MYLDIVYSTNVFFKQQVSSYAIFMEWAYFPSFFVVFFLFLFWSFIHGFSKDVSKSYLRRIWVPPFPVVLFSLQHLGQGCQTWGLLYWWIVCRCKLISKNPNGGKYYSSYWILYIMYYITWLYYNYIIYNAFDELNLKTKIQVPNILEHTNMKTINETESPCK